MTIEQLVSAYLTYLQNNNRLVGNPYPSSYLETRASEFRQGLQYAENILKTNPSCLDSESGILDLVKGIHERCAAAVYRIPSRINSNERCGTYRHQESFSQKIVPLINCNNPNDLKFLRVGKMPQMLDLRLQKRKINPNMLTTTQKEQAMHDQPAWLVANDNIQITAYIQAHLGEKEQYYFLCAYYKLHCLDKKYDNDPRAMVFKDYQKREINQLGQKLKLSFQENDAITPEEQIAYDRVYVSYPAPDRIENLMSSFLKNLIPKISTLSSANSETMAYFCFDTLNQFLQIHPFLDADYLSISILINILLSHHGYEWINFHDSKMKNVLSIAFNCSSPDENLAIAMLQKALVKNQKNNDASEVLPELFKKYECTQIDKAIRCAAGMGNDKDLAALLKLFPDMIDIPDQNSKVGRTALHWAIEKNRMPCVIELLNAGAKYDIPDKTDKTDKTAVDVALEKANKKILELLLQHILKKYLNETSNEDTNKEKALRIAASKGDLAAVKILLAHNTAINAIEPETKKTALHQATFYQHHSVVAFLINAGTDLTLIDKDDKKAVEYCKGNEALLQLFSNPPRHESTSSLH